MRSIVPSHWLAAATSAAILLGAWPPHAPANCGAAFCSLSTDWAGQGIWSEPGWRSDLRYEYIRQDQLREGRKVISLDTEEAEAKGLHHLEKESVNRNLIATLDATLTERFGVSVSIPYLDREHEHLALAEHGHDELGGAPLRTWHSGAEAEPETERWSFQELGDLRVLGRYRFGQPGFPGSGPETGLLFGLKLPTGAYDIANGEGEKAERSLQPGSGTTDAIAGAFLHDRLGGDGSYFAELLLQEPLAEAGHYAPGTKLSLDTGYRYQAGDSLGLMAQLNLAWKGKDSGSAAEPEDSGGIFLFLSPGIAWSVTRDVQIYAFWQQPLLQDVNGIQLTARNAYALGGGWRF